MEIVVPELGESIVEATVGRWLKQPGERVAVGEPVVALETDKVDLEVGAKEDGVLAEIRHQEGEDVKVGEVLGVIEAAPSGAASSQPAAAEAPAKAPSAEKAEGDGAKNRAQAKVTSEVEATAQAEASPGPAIPEGGGMARGTTLTPPAEERATPVARRMAQELGIDIQSVPGTGPGERVTKEDLQAFIARQAPAASHAAAPAASAPQSPAPAPAVAAPTAAAGQRGEQRVKLSRRRRTIAARLVEAQHTAAMLTTFNDVDMSAVMEIRQRRKESFQQRYGVKLGFMSFFVKAAIGALRLYPQVNAELQGDELVLKPYYDIGMAIGAEEGLVVPVLRDADRMSFAEIEKAIQAYVEKAGQGALALEDLRGGTFTITNGGVFGSLLSTPILNPPQVAILGLHRIESRPVAVDGQVVIRPMMYLALSYDHRVVDGREAVQFLVKVKELIQDPETLLLEG